MSAGDSQACQGEERGAWPGAGGCSTVSEGQGAPLVGLHSPGEGDCKV